MHWRAWTLAIAAACGDSPAAESGDTSTATTTSATPTSDGSADTSSTAASSSSSSGDGARACNGAAALCDRPLDDVGFPTTHNSAAALEYGFSALNANQTHGLRRQLDDGIRGLMLDVTLVDGETLLCHGPCGLGQLPHTDALAILAEFLADNPDEVIIIIYEDSAPASAIEADWQTSGLVDEAFVLGEGPWPTLGALIDARTRIVVTAENAGPPPPWLQHAWDLIWDTPYTFHTPREFSCDSNRGTAGQGLLLVNHWLSTDADLPDPGAAAQANDHDVLLARAQTCAAQWDHRVNLLGVDFYEQGALFDVVTALQ